MKRSAKIVLAVLAPAMASFGCGPAARGPADPEVASQFCDNPKQPGPDGQVPAACPPRAQGNNAAHAHGRRMYSPWLFGPGWFGGSRTATGPGPTHSTGATPHTSSTHRGGFGGTGSHMSGLS